MITHTKWHTLFLVMILLIPASCRAALADDGNQFAQSASDALIPFLVAGELSLALDGKNGRQHAVQAAQGLLVTGIATQTLKWTIRASRPGGDAVDGFPSGHTSAAFAMATAIADYKPKYGWLAYGTAAVIGWSRVQVKAHTWDEVIAGALLGHYVAKHYSSNDHVTISPNGITIRW